MEISRIFRILITLIFVIAFILVTVAAYRKEERMNSMSTLSDVSTSLAVDLASRDLAWVDSRGIRHITIIDPAKLPKVDKEREILEKTFRFQISLLCLENSEERKIGPYGENRPEKMRCTYSLPVSIYLNNEITPAKLKVIVWYA